MSAQIQYAYLKGQTWLYRRNYPREVAVVLGSQALKQSLKTGDPKLAKKRAAEVNTRYEATVAQVLEGAQSVAQSNSSTAGWSDNRQGALACLRATLQLSEAVPFQKLSRQPKTTVGEAVREYLIKRQRELRPGGFKSVRYSLELFSSKYGDRPLVSLAREDGREFLSLVSQLSPLVGKSPVTRGLGLEALVRWSARGTETITVRTQRRIWSQVNHFLDWSVSRDHLAANPLKAVQLDQKVRPASYAVPTDDEVVRLLRERDPALHRVLLVCLLSGMRSGEAVGLRREDVVAKGNLGSFFHVRPNDRRQLKTEAAERLVPVHPVLEEVLAELPRHGPLFPYLTVNIVTKRFAWLRNRLQLDRPGLVFHGTRKWFITQCERTGVPEHFTASLVGHKSARSENGITYGIYSAGISDEQKRGIVDQIRLPT